MKNYLIFTTVLLLIGITAFSQEKTISGRATDLYYFPLTGVQVKAYGSDTGTTTDKYGRYSITVPESTSSLVFSREGLVPEFVDLKGKRTEYNVPMKLTFSRELPTGKEFGYRMLATNMVYSPAAGLNENTTLSFSTLFGRFGLTFSENNHTVRLRSLPCSLFIVDGVKFSGEDFYNTFVPYEIQDIKAVPPPATIYGREGVNGAIIVTTVAAAANGEHYTRGSNRLFNFTGEKQKELFNQIKQQAVPQKQVRPSAPNIPNIRLK